MLTVALAGVGAALLAALPAHAAAPPLKVPPNVEIVVILAMQADAGPDDKEVANWPTAAKPPLSLYKTRKVLQHVTRAPLEKGKPYVVTVDAGPTLSLTFKDVIAAEEHKPERYSIGAVLQAGGGSTNIGIVAKGDDRLFIAGPSYQQGTLFFGVHVLK
jgi:hypothetical protein